MAQLTTATTYAEIRSYSCHLYLKLKLSLSNFELAFFPSNQDAACGVGGCAIVEKGVTLLRVSDTTSSIV